MVKKIHILDVHVLGNHKARGREVQKAVDPGVDEVVGGTLGAVRGSGDDAYLDLQGLDLFRQFLRTLDLETRDLLADLEGVAVKRANEMKPAAFELLMVKKSAPEVADPDQGYAPLTVHTERLFDRGVQVVRVIAHATNAEFSKVGEVLAYFRWIDVASLGQRVGRDDVNAFADKSLKDLDVQRKALNGGLGNVIFFGAALGAGAMSDSCEKCNNQSG